MLDCTRAAHGGDVEQKSGGQDTFDGAGSGAWICVRDLLVHSELLLDLPNNVPLWRSSEAGGAGDIGLVQFVSGALPCVVRLADQLDAWRCRT